MTTTHRLFNLVGVAVPFVAFLAAVVLLWNDIVGPSDIAVLLVMYAITGIGISVGYHRLLTHNAFATRRSVRNVLAVMGSMAVQGPAIMWVADHRKHHAHTDVEGDPHSPHVGPNGQRRGVRGAIAGLWQAHIGWLFTELGRAQRKRYAADLWEDPTMRRIDRHFLTWVALSLAIPFTLGWLLTGALAGALTALLWGGLVRIFLLHHVTWSINSVCHFFGRRRFDTDDHSRNVFWLALISFGESWHHNHHAFPRSAFHGLSRWEPDPAGWVVSALERVGLAWNVVRISSERQSARLAEARG